MTEFAPSFEISRDIAHREIHWTSRGFWSVEEAHALTKALYKESLPFIEKRERFRVLGDLREFKVQSQDVVNVMLASQEGSAQLGVDRMAIVISSTLVKVQFRRISEALKIEFFEEHDDAIAWLREEI